MRTLEKPKEMAMIKPRPDRQRVDVEAAYKAMIRKLPKTFAHLAK
jgi:hypothetical protein